MTEPTPEDRLKWLEKSLWGPRLAEFTSIHGEHAGHSYEAAVDGIHIPTHLLMDWVMAQTELSLVLTEAIFAQRTGDPIPSNLTETLRITLQRGAALTDTISRLVLQRLEVEHGGS